MILRKGRNPQLVERGSSDEKYLVERKSAAEYSERYERGAEKMRDRLSWWEKYTMTHLITAEWPVLV